MAKPIEINKKGELVINRESLEVGKEYVVEWEGIKLKIVKRKDGGVDINQI